MIKAVIIYSKASEIVQFEVEAKTLIALLDVLQQADYEYTRNGYKFRATCITRICEREN